MIVADMYANGPWPVQLARASRPRIAPAAWLRWRLRAAPAPLLAVFRDACELGFGVGDVANAVRQVGVLERNEIWREAFVRVQQQEH